MAAKSRGKRYARKSGNLVWTVVTNDSFTINPGVTVSGSDIVSDSDWTVLGGMERATILRVRGWFGINVEPALALTAGGPVFGYIGLFDGQEPSTAADLATTYNEEDILTTFGWQFPYTNIGEAPGPTWHQDIDVKAMRKIRSGQDLRFVLTNLHSLKVEVSFVLRALLKRS